MKNYLQRSTLIAALLLSANFVSFAQTAARPAVEERNVRAQMQFLAGDAMQGRGSGTQFERIAAEYVGSQFMQFGLEPAGETGFDGKPAYVQTASRVRNTFEENPTLTIGTAILEHSKQMLVLRTNTDSVIGSLQKIDISGKPDPGAVVFVRLPTEVAGPNLMRTLSSFAASGASVVLFEETSELRANRDNIAGRRVSYAVNSASAKPMSLIAVTKEFAEAISALPDGTRIAFGGKTTQEMQQSWNAVGKITGMDKTLGSEIILLSSHLDHLGIRPNAPGDDKIFNGADDDASGTVAVLELARALASVARPKRTVYFVCFGSEESGGIGATYFVNNLPFPKEKLVANLEFEMIGRPDAKVKADELWLTGYERSNLGSELAKRGAKLVQDPHPEENFFQRSDNYTLARQGIIAHTVSSFGLHTDYHKASDEVETIDFSHMTRSINSMVIPVQWLVNSDFKPAWAEGKKP